MRKITLLTLLLLTFNTSYALGKWECVGRIVTCHTWRLWVPQGWVVSGDIPTDEHGYAMTYVPDPSHEWKL